MRIHLAIALLFVGYCVSAPINKVRLKKIVPVSENFGGITCSACKVAVEILHFAFETGMGKGSLIKVADYVCKTVKIETNRVCLLAIREFASEVWDIFVSDVITPQQICALAFGKGCSHKERFFASWNITIPEVTKYTPKSSHIGIMKGSAPTLKVLHISDTHLDNDYMEGSVAECDEPLCCRKNDGKAGKGQIPAGKYGYAGYCDTNLLLLNNLFAHLAKTHGDVDYILWTGDIPPHNVWNQTRTDQEKAITQATQLFGKYFPNKKIYPTIGNHEGVPVNSFPPPSIWGGNIRGDAWLFDTLVEDWTQWLPDDTVPTIKKGGFYTTLIRKGLRIVSLNTNYGHGDNWWLAIKSRDPADQLQWLVSVLLQAEKDGEKVHIIGHVPPGQFLKWFGFNFYRIVDRFHNTITGQFYGHTHHDEFRVFYDMKTYKLASNIAYVGPSVTTYHELNPGYRVYEIDGASANSSMSVVNHQTFILDLAKANKTGIAEWTLEYSAKETFEMNNLSSSAWDDLINRMLHDDALFELFYKSYYKQHIKTKCTGQCKINYLCTMKSGGAIHNMCNFDEKQKRMYAKWFSETYNKC